jgi:hypothetical protein
MTSIIKVNQIQDGGGNAIITSDGSGNITTQNVASNTPDFQAYMSSAQTISSGTHTKVQFNSEVFDSAGEYDHSTNYRWSPQTTGRYLVAGFMRLQATTDEVWVQLRKNGSTFMTLADTRVDAEWMTGGLRILDHTSASDYYEIWVYQGSGGNLTSGTGIEISEFSAFKIIE